MGQDTLLTEEIDAGHTLVERLIDEGFEIDLAFWVKEAEAGRWYLYLVSPIVDSHSLGNPYRRLLPLIESMPELGIDPFKIKLVGLNDSMAVAAREIVRPRVPDSPFAVQRPRPYRGMTRFGGSTLGGVEIDGAFIYPPLQTERTV